MTEKYEGKVDSNLKITNLLGPTVSILAGASFLSRSITLGANINTALYYLAYVVIFLSLLTILNFIFRYVTQSNSIA